MKNLTKQEQSKMANGIVKRLTRAHPSANPDMIDFKAEIELIATHPTKPWEYPWTEVLRWCRDQRR